MISLVFGLAIYKAYQSTLIIKVLIFRIEDG
jgi:hypothetical protein